MGMTRLGVALALLAAGAAAQEPDYFRAPVHALAVRAAPGGEPVGELAPGAGPIEATGYDETGAWARIIFGESDGWVAVDALAPMAVPSAAYAEAPVGLICAGTEPFWSLRLDPETVSAEAPGEHARTLRVEAAAVARGAARFPLALNLGDATAVLRAAQCEDGMTDRSYAWSVDLLIARPGAVGLRTGCCRVPPAR